MYSTQDLADFVKMHPLTVREYLDDFDIQTPGWDGWKQDEFEAIANIITEGARKNSTVQIRVGADPEFEVKTSTGDVRAAHRWFSGVTSSVGVDGASHTGELRPRPGSPERVTSNIRKLMERVKDRLPDNFNVGAGSGNRYPLGGHIHISGRRQSEILLDKFEQFITVPLNAKSNQRIRGSYGNSRSWRNQPHGWEYRSPCSWLAHPVVTRGALVIAYALCEMEDPDLEKHIHTKEDLISAMGIVRGRFAKEFWDFLDSVTSLESIDVFRSWNLVKPDYIQEQTVQINPTALPIPDGRIPVNINMEDDFMLPFVSMGLHTAPQMPVTLVGARRSRFPRENRVVIPEAWGIPYTDLSNLMQNLQIPEHWCNVSTWEMGTVGMSYGLRQKVMNSSWRNGRRPSRNSIWNRARKIIQTLISSRGLENINV